MMQLLERISLEVMQAFEKAGYDKELGRVTISNRPDLCEYQCNGALSGAKRYHKAPLMIAQEVADILLESDTFSKAEAVKPGFLNMDINKDRLCAYLQEMKDDEQLGVESEKQPKTIIIDYGGANAAKPLHVGHLRSAVIGESVHRATG